MDATYEAKKLKILHYLQLNQSRWFRWTELSVYNWNGQVTITHYCVMKACIELEQEGKIYRKLKSTGHFNRYLVRAVDSITLVEFRKLHPRLKYKGVREYDYPCRIWSSKRWFYKPDSPYRHCERCIDYKMSVIFGVLPVQKMRHDNPLFDIPF